MPYEDKPQRNGYSWHQAVATRADEPGPCYEIYWDENGTPSHTDRYAIIPRSIAEASEKVIRDDPLYDPDEHRRDDDECCTRETFLEHWQRMSLRPFAR